MAFERSIVLALRANTTDFVTNMGLAQTALTNFKTAAGAFGDIDVKGAQALSTAMSGLAKADPGTKLQTAAKGIHQLVNALNRLAKTQGLFTGLQNAIQNIAAYMKRFNTAMAPLSSALSRFGKSASLAATGLNELSAATKEGAASLLALQTAAPGAAAGANQLGRSAGKVSTQMSAAATSTQKFGTSLANVRWQGGIKGFLALAAAQAKFIAAGAILFGILNQMRNALTRVFEISEETAKSFAFFTGGLGGTAEEFARISDVIVENSNKLGVSVAEVNTAFRELALAGLGVEEATAALNPVLQLAVGTNADLASTAKTVAGVYKVFASDLQSAADVTEGYAEVADVLAKAATITLSDVNDLAQGIKFTGNVAKQAGFSFQETVSILALLNDNLIRAGLGGRGLRTVLVSLIGRADELASAFGVGFQPERAFESLVDVLKAVSVQLNDVNKAQEASAKIAQIFGRRGIAIFQTLASNIDANVEILRKLNEEAEGTVEGFTRIRTEDLAGRLRRLGQSFVNLVASGLEPFGRALELLLRLLNPFVEGLTRLTRAVPDWAQNILAAAAAIAVLNKVLHATWAVNFGRWLIALPLVEKGMLALGLATKQTTTGYALLAPAQAKVTVTTITLSAAMDKLAISARAAWLAVAGPVGLAVALAGLGIATISMIERLDKLGFTLNDFRRRSKETADEQVHITEEMRKEREEMTKLANAGAQLVKNLKDREAELAGLAQAQDDGAQAGDALTRSIEERIGAIDEEIAMNATLIRSYEEFDSLIINTGRDLLDMGEAAEDFGKAALQATTDLFKAEDIRKYREETGSALRDLVLDFDRVSGTVDELSKKLADLEQQRKFADPEELRRVNTQIEITTRQLTAATAEASGLKVELRDAFKSAEGGFDLFKQVEPLTAALVPRVIINNLDHMAISAKIAASELAALEHAQDNLTASQKRVNASLEAMNQSIVQFSLSVKRTQLDKQLEKVFDPTLHTEKIRGYVNEVVALTTAGTQKLIEAEQTRLDHVDKAILKSVQRRLRYQKEGRDELAKGEKAIETNLRKERESHLTVISSLEIEIASKTAQQKAAIATQLNQKLNQLDKNRIKEANDLLTLQIKNEAELQREQRKGLTQLEQYEEVQSLIGRQLKDVRVSPFDDTSIARSKAALQEARTLLSELPKQAIKDGDEVLASEEDIADTRLRLLRKIQQASESVAREELNTAQDNYNKTEATVQKLESSLLELQKTVGDTITNTFNPAAAETAKILGNQVIPAADGTAASLDTAFGDGSKQKLTDYNKELEKTIQLLVAAQQVGQPGGEPKRWGGPIPGYGGGDSLHYMLEPGEWVHRKEVRSHYGDEFMNALDKFQVPKGVFNAEESEGAPGNAGDTFVFAPQFSAEDLRSIRDMDDEQVEKLLDRIGGAWERWLFRKKGRNLGRAVA